MSVTPSSRVVGMFTERAMADDAVDALHNAGFEDERISYSTPGTSGGFFEDIKSLFTGTNPGADNLIHNLTDIGLSNEQAQYYADEYNNGNTILVVNAPGREEQVLSILHQYGAYSAHSAGVQFGGAAATAADSVPPAVDATQPHNYSSTWAEPNSYAGSEAGVQNNTPDLDTQSQFQYQSSNDQPLSSQPQETAAPITPLHDVEDQPTRPITSEYATEPHHASDEVVTSEYNVENGTGASDLHVPAYEGATSTIQSSFDAPTSQIEDQTAEPATTAPEYGTTEGETTQPAATTYDSETIGEPTAYSEATTSKYGATWGETTQPAATTSEHEVAGEHVDQPAATISEYGTTEGETTQPAATISEYGTPEDQIVHPATTTSDYETSGEPAVQPATTTSEYEAMTDRASHASVTTPEGRRENQMAEPTSVAPEHEIEEGLPQAGAAVTEQPEADQTVSPVSSATDAYSTTEEPLLSQQGIAEPEPAIVEQTGQPESVLTTHDVAQQQGTEDSTLTAESDAVTQEQPILNTTVPPAGADTLDSATTLDSTTTRDSVVASDSTSVPDTTTASNSTITSDSAVAGSQPETVTTPPAQTNAPVVDYAGKLQSLQQQLQASQQQLQEVKARLQAAKEHETQIQATQQQLKAVQDELAAAHAELNETHSRIDQY